MPEPFFVIATQNPAEQLGTHPLPESQLDRFLMCISLGLPDRAAERELLSGEDSREQLRRLQPVLDTPALLALQARVLQIHASPALLDYLQALLAATRSGDWFAQGLSPRAGLALLRAARARALLQGRDHVSPEDLQSILPQCVAHRLSPRAGSGRGSREQVRAMVEALPLP